MSKLKLFIELVKSDIFYFYDKPGRLLIKSDRSHYISPEGRRLIDPLVAIMKAGRKRKVETDGSEYNVKVEPEEPRS